MPVAFTCPKCSKTARVPDEAVGKKIKCPACQTVSVVPGGKAAPAASGAGGAGASAAGAAAGTIPASCPKCKKAMRLPAAAAGKNVKCPACQTPFAVPSGAPKAVAAAAPVAAAAAPAFDAAFAPTAGIPFDEDLISERDFDVAGVGSVPKQEKKEEINIGKGPVGPRGSKTYKVPGIMTLVAGILNFIGDVTLIVLAAITVSKMTNADIGIYIWVSIVGFFSILDAVRISLGSIAVLTRSSRPRVFLACSELLFAPVFGTLLASNTFSWTVSFIIGGVFLLFTWPIVFWLVYLIGGEQGKIDFGDLTKDDIEEQAQELRRRASGLGGGGH